MPPSVTTMTFHHNDGKAYAAEASIKYTSKNDKKKVINKVKKKIKANRCNDESFEEMPWYVAITAFCGFQLLLILGYIGHYLLPPVELLEKFRKGYPRLYVPFEKLYVNYIYRRIRDGWEKPVCGVPGVEIVMKDKITNDNGWTYDFTDPLPPYLNLGSYNYLGFAQSNGPCADAAVETLKVAGLATCSPINELGSIKLINDLETLTARFLGVESAIVFGMGFATNSLNINAIIPSDSLVLSDEKNHASLILGLKLCGADLRVYKHNNMDDLEKLLIRALKERAERAANNEKQPWNRIYIVCEGIFSMEGSIIKLPKLLELKKKYKFYIYLDEAHSIGALGPNGRGAVDYYNCNPKDVDILMGTFTKSFGSAGGYVAGPKVLIDHIREKSDAVYYACSMPPVVAQQVYTSMSIIMGEDGTTDGIDRITQLKNNVKYFREGLKKMGLIVYGHEDSPVVPIPVYTYSKLLAVVRAYSNHEIAAVGVGYPATPFLECRMRFCLSGKHTEKHLKKVLEVTEEIAEDMGIKYSRQMPIVPKEELSYYEKEQKNK